MPGKLVERLNIMEFPFARWKCCTSAWRPGIRGSLEARAQACTLDMALRKAGPVVTDQANLVLISSWPRNRDSRQPEGTDQQPCRRSAVRTEPVSP